MSHPLIECQLSLNRRRLFQQGAAGMGIAALSTLLNGRTQAAADTLPDTQTRWPHFAAKAKRVIYLFQSGAPSQMDLFDNKTSLAKSDGSELPDSVRMGQRLTGMTAFQKRFRVTKAPFGFRRCGESGATVSNQLPYLQGMADELCFIKSMHTEAINHDPAMTFFQSGSQIPGRPSAGAWLSYGLGSDNADLPNFVVMASKGSGRQMVQPLYNRLWSAGFLPSSHQGVKFRSTGEPMLYLSNPAGISREQRRGFLDDLAALNEQQVQKYGDPEITTRIKQYEMAYRMQTSVPELLDMSDEPDWVFDMYGPESKIKGTYAY
ncbi:MAG: DUF1501 domain-containing protein, partial [Fuerstiella sp.]